MIYRILLTLVHSCCNFDHWERSTNEVASFESFLTPLSGPAWFLPIKICIPHLQPLYISILIPADCTANSQVVPSKPFRPWWSVFSICSHQRTHLKWLSRLARPPNSPSASDSHSVKFPNPNSMWLSYCAGTCLDTLHVLLHFIFPHQ